MVGHVHNPEAGPDTVFTVLYTKHITRKRKVYHDATVSYSEQERAAVLRDEDGSVLSRVQFLDKPLHEGEEDVSCFPGFLVNIESVAKRPCDQDGKENSSGQRSQREREPGRGRNLVALKHQPQPSRTAPKAPVLDSTGIEHDQDAPNPGPRSNAAILRLFGLPDTTEEASPGPSPEAGSPATSDDGRPEAPAAELKPQALPAPQLCRRGRAGSVRRQAVPDAEQLHGGSRWSCSRPQPQSKEGGDAVAAASGRAAATVWKPPQRGSGTARWAPPKPQPTASHHSNTGHNRRQQIEVPAGTVGLAWLQLRAPTSFPSGHRPQRSIRIPTCFPTQPRAYLNVMASALAEELELKLAPDAQRFSALVRKLASSATSGCAPNQPAAVDAAALESACRKAGLWYYSDCELLRFSGRGRRPEASARGGGRRGRRKHRRSRTATQQGVRASGSDGRANEAGESSEELSGGSEDEQRACTDTTFLVIKSGRRTSSCYQKDGLFLLGLQPDLGSLQSGQGTCWVAPAAARWHGPDINGKLQVELLCEQPWQLPRSCQAYALQGPDGGMELSLLRYLATLDLQQSPLIQHLLAPGTADGGASSAAVDADHRASIGTWQLNPSQERVAAHVRRWMQLSRSSPGTRHAAHRGQPAEPIPGAAEARAQASGHGQPAPICLVHGPFGTGKSSLLLALIQIMLSKRSDPSSPIQRVVVLAHTNVAVDRVLEGLLQQGFCDLLRLGSLRRMSPALLPYSLHYGSSGGGGADSGAAAVKELKSMLQDARSLEEAAVLRTELAQAEEGALRQRAQRLRSAAVVGLTCCAASQGALAGQRFDVAVLDESSQIVEPLSTAPVLQLRCRFLVAAGDPHQLPPILAEPAAVSRSSAPQRDRADGNASGDGLSRTLFSRLAQSGLQPFLLNTQYRCHPSISCIANTLFYSGKLTDGVLPEQRLALVPGLPPLVWLDVQGKCQQQERSRSSFNRQEVAATRSLVAALVARGVEPAAIGVICFFRAQADAIAAALCGGATAPQHRRSRNAGGREDAAEEEVGATGRYGDVKVATVDAFQGAEKEVIVLSTTVTSTSAFCTDAHRLNVALTRAKRHLFIVGSSNLKSASSAFAHVFQLCRADPHGCLPHGHLPKCLSEPAHSSSPPRPPAVASQPSENTFATTNPASPLQDPNSKHSLVQEAPGDCSAPPGETVRRVASPSRSSHPPHDADSEDEPCFLIDL